MIKFSGVHITSKDPKRLALFYKDILGWTMLDDNPDFDGVRFEGRGDDPVLWIWDENKHGTLSDGTMFFTFDCPDTDTMYQNLTEKGLVLNSPEICSWGGKEIKLTDPDGNKILLVE